MLTNPLLNITQALRDARSADEAAQHLVQGVTRSHAPAFLYYRERWVTVADTSPDPLLQNAIANLASFVAPQEDDQHLWIPVRDGDNTIGLFVTTPTPDNALVVLLVALFAEIAMRAKHERADAMFRQTIDKANLPIDIHDVNGTLIYRNAAWDTLFATDTDEPVQFIDRLRKEEQALPETQIYPNAQSKAGWADFVTIVSAEGIEKEARMSVVALRDADDEIVGYSTFTDDVSELHDLLGLLEQQTTRLAAAASVSKALITTQEIDQFTQQVLSLICMQFEYDFARVYLINESRTALRCMMASDYDGNALSQLHNHTVSLTEDTVARKVITTGRWQLTEDITDHERHLARAVMMTDGSELTLILKATDRVQGVLVVNSKQANAFSAEDVELMRSISDQLAIAISNVELVTQLTERVEDMRAMGEVSLLVQSAFDIDALMTRVFEALMRVQPAGTMAFALYDASADQLEITQIKEGKKTTVKQALGDDLPSQILAHATPIFWRTADERLATATYFDVDSDQLPASFLGLPLIAREQLLGVLYTQADQYDIFDENDLQFMQTLVNSAAFAIENMQLIEDTRQRVQEMEIINNISQTLSENFGTTTMWDSVLTELMDLFPQGLTSVMLYNRASGALSLPASHDDSLLFMPPEPLARVVVEHGITLEFDDLSQADTRLNRLGIDPFSLNLGALRAWIGVPLKSRTNKTIGIISLQSDRPAGFSQRDFSLLNTVAAQLSMALDNARLLQSEQERRALANSLIDVGRVVSSTLNMDEVFERIFKQIERLVSFERATILLTGRDNTPLSLTLRAVSGINTDVVIRGQKVIVAEKSPLAKVLLSLEPVTLSATDDPAAWQSQPEIFNQSNNTTWMGIPLIVQSEVIGAITLENTDAYIYTPQDAKPIFALARQAAVAVRNARLHTQAEQNVASLRERSNRLASMHYLAIHISSSLSQQDIVDNVTKILTDLFKADYAAVVRIDPVDGNGYLTAEHPRTREIGQAVMVSGTPSFDAFQKVVRDNRPVYTRMQDNADHMLPDSLAGGGYAIAPLVAYEYLIGNITLGFNDPDYDFNEERIETFMTIAAQVAVALRNAELFQEALDAARLKTEFLANVSHELRTPLNAIIGYSELLLSGTYGTLKDKQLDRVERVFRSGRELLMLIDDILDLSKIETGKMELEMGRLDIGLLVQDALGTIEPQAQRKALPIHVNIPKNLPPVFADGNRMRQVLVNLLSNAVKFTTEGDITLSAKTRSVTLKEFPELPAHMVVQNSQWIQVSITDTGIGIADDDQKMIFDAFTQADGSTVREYDGTGLGLAITQRLVRMHKGHIWLESALGTGSTFHFILPTMETLQRPQYVLSPDDNRPVVIIADEDELTLQLMSEFVDTDNYRVIVARSVEQIVKIASQVKPMVIFTDLMMPGMEGMQVIEHLKSDDTTASVPIIICSILERQRDAYELGATAFMKKPLNRNAFRRVLENVQAGSLSS